MDTAMRSLYTRVTTLVYLHTIVKVDMNSHQFSPGDAEEVGQEDAIEAFSLPDMSCTCGKLRKASRQLTRLYDRALQPLDLKLTQYSLLVHIARDEGQSISNLATQLAMDRTTLTRNLRPLVNLGWVSVRFGSNARRRSVSTTPAGRRLLAEAVSSWRSVEERVLATIGRDEAKNLHCLLDGIARHDWDKEV